MINSEKIEVLFAEVALLRDDLKKTIQSANRINDIAGAPETLAALIEKYETMERYGENVKALENASLNALSRSKRINLISYFIMLVVTVGFSLIAGLGFGTFLAYEGSEKLYFEDRRARLIQNKMNDIKLLERLQKRGVFFSEKTILAPPEIVEFIGESENGKQGIWFKQ